MNYFVQRMPSPVGELTLVATGKKLVAILWEDDKPGRVKLKLPKRLEDNAILKETRKQLREYFAGKRRSFSLPVDFEGTPFQKDVWKALQKIPYGKTLSYAELAEKVGSARAFRAVGSANGRNPVSIVVPCHRVIAKDGKLAGFAGGLPSKRYLLELEKTGM